MSITPITTTSVSALLPKLSEADQKKFDTVKANLQSALDTLKSSSKNNSGNAQRKAMAQQRIAQIKQSIKTLRQFQGLDAKAAARMVAQLAKQLSQAVKDYQAAGGSDASVSSSVSTAPVATTSSTPAGDSNSSDAQTATPQSNAASAYAQTQQIAVPDGSDAADKAFLKDVNEIKNDLRNFTKQLRNSIKTSKFMPQSMDPDLKDVRAADNALDEVDQSVISAKK